MHQLEAERKKIEEIAKKVDSIGTGSGVALSGSMRAVAPFGQSRTCRAIRLLYGDDFEEFFLNVFCSIVAVGLTHCSRRTEERD